MIHTLTVLILLLYIHLTWSYYIRNKNNHNITTLNNLTFGSCYNGINHLGGRFDIFDAIDKHNPNLWIWTGDAAYIRYAKDKIKIRYKILNSLFRLYYEFNDTRVEEKFNQTKYNDCIFFYNFRLFQI